jgi:hypothetical protein
MAELTFSTQLDLLRNIVQMVFEWGQLDVRQWAAFQAKCQRLKTKPAWYST